MKHRFAMLSSTLLFTSCAHAFPSVRSLFKKPVPETIINKEYTVKPNTVVSIENMHGDIYIKTEWNQNSIVLSGTEKTSPREGDTIDIISEQKESGELYIKTNASHKKTKASMDIVVIAPTNSSLNFITKNGNIGDSGDLNGTIVATTDNGAIKLHGTHATIEATALNRGTITVTNATKDVIAQSNKGFINICCDELNAHNKVWAKSKKGMVTLALPEKVDARLYAKSERGTVQSDRPVTLTSRTTELNRKSWQNFKQEVEGSIGLGQDAEIKVVAGSSIKINNATT